MNMQSRLASTVKRTTSMACFVGLSLQLGLVPSALSAQTASAPYVWKNVIIHGGGFVSGVTFSPAKKGLVYARTDVGGAYRSDDAGEHWIPITDSLGRKASNATGIESLAVDPSDPNKVYLAGGLYTADWAGPGAMLRSSDQGRTWQSTTMTFKMGGNEDGRNCGEKLAVDPNLGSVLYFGSRKAGLWKSVDSGATWFKVSSFPVQALVEGPWQKVEISFVTFDPASGIKGTATPTIYVGVAQAGSSLYRSDDAGKTWSLVPGAPKTLFPSHAANNRSGAFYFSFIDNIGPNGIADGEIMKYTPKDGKWQDVSPVKPGVAGAGKFGFGGLGIDAAHPDTLMVTTIDRWWPGDIMYRTTDGGKHWRDVHADAVYSAPNDPWVYWHKDTTGGTGWMGDIEIDPFNSDKVMYTTGEGIWGSADITATDKGKPSHWGFPNDGLEETVPLTLISPPEGPHLLSGVGDIGGFRHEDLTKSPSGGFFANPVMNNTDSLDFAALQPSIVVRVGRGGGKDVVHAAYSTNGGGRWKPMESEPPTSKYGSGRIAISADGAVVVWTPDKGSAHWSADMGHSWTACGGLSDTLNVVSDRQNPNKFYSFNPKTGKLYESLDKGRNFAERQAPVAPSGSHVMLAPAPGIDGDLWVVAADTIYHSSDSGVTFSQVAGLSNAHSLGFGMPAPGQTYPALYVVAEYNKVDGVYRSDDTGKTWLRINDDEHQYGWIGSIIGDPRVYGRVYFTTGGRGIIYGDIAAAR